MSGGSWADGLLPDPCLDAPILHPNDGPEVREFLEAGMTAEQVARERARLAQVDECCMFGCHQPVAETHVVPTLFSDGETVDLTYRLCAGCSERSRTAQDGAA